MTFTFEEKLRVIDILIEEGVLGEEECPSENELGAIVWSWCILKPSEIPLSLKNNVAHGRIWL